MDIHFVAQIDASADVVAFPVRKGELNAFVQALGEPHGALLSGAAAQARFEGMWSICKGGGSNERTEE